MEITEMLLAMRQGDATAVDRLLSIVYRELRQMAASRLTREAPGHTLQPTALVHETWLKLVGSDHSGWDNRRHFFGAAVEAMRRVLVDNARYKRSLKRGGPGATRCDLNDSILVQLPIEDEVIDLSEALDEFDRVDPLEAQVVKLKFFGSMTNAEVASVLGLSLTTVERYWTYSRAWLNQRLAAYDTRSESRATNLPPAHI